MGAVIGTAFLVEKREEVDVPREGLDALVRRAQKGDVDAFEELYRANVGRAYALCLRMTGEAGLAEELAQEVFVRTWEKLHTFRGESAFTTWLHRLTVNVVLGAQRKEARHRSRIIVTDDLTAFEKKGATPSPGLRIDMERAIASLPEGARQVFVLHDIEGYKHREIAEQMGTATGTCKAQLHRARKLLRAALGEGGA